MTGQQTYHHATVTGTGLFYEIDKARLPDFDLFDQITGSLHILVEVVA
jgi:hypothetical protein